MDTYCGVTFLSIITPKIELVIERARILGAVNFRSQYGELQVLHPNAKTPTKDAVFIRIKPLLDGADLIRPYVAENGPNEIPLLFTDPEDIIALIDGWFYEVGIALKTTENV